MNKSEQINELACALSKAQGQMNGAKKDASNPFFKSKYADLASVWDACRAPLSVNGLAVVQTTTGESAELVTVETILTHASGQWISSVISMKPTKNDPQGVGSCLTYARRYGLSAMVGIAPEDDDGNRASIEPKTPTKADYVNRISKFLDKEGIIEKFVVDLCIEKKLCADGVTELDELSGEVLSKMASDEGLKRILARWNEAEEVEEVVVESAPIETMDEVSWKETVVLKGEFQGKKLKDLSEEEVFSIYRGFKPSADVEAIRFKKALVQWMHEVQSKEGK